MSEANPQHSSGIISKTEFEMEVSVRRDKRPSKSPLTESVNRLVEATLPQISQQDCVLQVMWMIVYVAATSCFIWQFVVLLENYYAYPTNVAIQIVSMSPLEFPAVTVCNENPLRKSSVARIRDFEDLVLLDDYALQSVRSYSNLAFGQVNFRPCSDGFHECRVTKTCVPPQWVCNGVDNCGDASDEDTSVYNCDEIRQSRIDNVTDIQGVCKWPFIQCPNLSSLCANPCDGISECEDNFDESSNVGCVESTCEFLLTALDTFQELNSPNYPGNYGSQLDCIWRIRSDSERVEITILEAQIEGESELCMDYLQLFDGTDSNSEVITVDGSEKFCGYQPPLTSTYTSKGNYLTILFRSNVLVSMKGFRIAYKSVAGRTKRHVDVEEELDNRYFGPFKRVARSVHESYAVSDFKTFADPEPVDYFTIFKATERSGAKFGAAVVFSQEVMMLNGNQIDDFIVQCSFDGSECQHDLFRVFQDTHYGNCFTFNSALAHNDSASTPGQYTSKSGREHGLKVTLFLDVENYIGVLASLTAARVAIHDSRVMPHLRSHGIIIDAGMNTFVSLKMQKIDRLGGKYSDCTSEWPDHLRVNEKFRKRWPKYDKFTCLDICVSSNLARRCGCTDGFEFGFSTDKSINDAAAFYCQVRNETQNECRENVLADFHDNKLGCVCPSACEVLVFVQSESSAAWPSKYFAPYLAKTFLRSESVKLKSVLSRIVNDTSLDDETLQKQLQTNFAKLEVFYEELSFEEISENAVYNFTGMFGDFGGILGLWLGWSVLVLFEMVQFLYEVASATLKSIRKH